MERASIDSIETLGLADGPGIRVVIFFNGCKLRCKYCHNPEMWEMKNTNYTTKELFDKIVSYKPYFKRNGGGVTFSGGEPLLHDKFIIELCEMLKNEEGIDIALDTSGVGNGNYEEVLKYVDLVIFDIKAVTALKYKELVGYDIDKSLQFLNTCQKMNKRIWLRQVIMPGINDSDEDILELKEFIRPLKNVEKVELLPYHLLGIGKYKKLGTPYSLEGIPSMDIDRLNYLSELLNKKV